MARCKSFEILRYIVLIKARLKPIIDMLEEIRGQLMSRQYKKLMALEGEGDGPKLCPNISQKLEKLKFESRICKCRPALQNKFQVQHGEDQFIVNMTDKSCSCRSWGLTGISCIHACSVMTFLKQDHRLYVAGCYTMERYKRVYSYGITPLNGHKMWPPVVGNPVKPPFHKVMPGRPKKKRRRGIEENDCRGKSRLPRVGTRMTCQKCMQEGHNQRSCKNQQIIQPPKPPAKRGRPFKRQPSTEQPSTEQGHSTMESQGQTSQVRQQRQASQQGQGQSQSEQILKERAQAKQGLGVMVGESGIVYARV